MGVFIFPVIFFIVQFSSNLLLLFKPAPIFFLLAVLCTFADRAVGDEKVSAKNTALSQLIIKARAQQIWQLPTWQALLHVSPSLLNSQGLSRVDAAAFFLSKQGKQSPQAELEATLEFLLPLSSEIDINDGQAVACRFPARRAWLKKVLEIDDDVLPEYRCARLNHWLRNLDADGLTLIFPVSVLNSPASMFGHTFLRLDRKAEKNADLLAWTVNFAAYADEGRGLGFAINGVFGGYQGRFTLAPYYERVKAYSDIENRDIWEYELNYSPAEIHFMLLHLWELLPGYFDYFFIDENCSYQLLALLDVVRPNLALSEKFHWDATPADTVRAIASVPDLVTQVHYRPSLRQYINTRAMDLGFAEQKMAKSLALGKSTLQDSSFLNKTSDSQVKILELATSYLAYLNASRVTSQDFFAMAGEAKSLEMQHGEQLNRQYQLLTARSEMAITLPPQTIQQPVYRPDEGHRSRRVGVRYGSEDAESYSQFDFRWVYHDQYDPDNGFVKGAQLAFLQPSFRYYSRESDWQFEGIDFVDISSAPVRNYFIRPFSWRALASLKRYRFEGGDRPLTGDFALAAGLSYELSQQAMASVFIDTKLIVGDKFDNNIGVGLGASTEIVYTLTDKWKAGLHAELMQYVEGVSQTSYAFGGKLRLSLDKGSAALLELTENREFSHSFSKAQLSWQYYF